MSEKIYLYNSEKSKYLLAENELKSFDKLRRQQLEKIFEKLLVNGELRGPNVDFMGNKVWKIQIKNDKNYYEQHRIRLGEEAPEPTFKKPLIFNYKSLEDLNKFCIEVVIIITTGWNTYEGCEYSIKESFELEKYFRVKGFKKNERADFLEIVNAKLLDRSPLHFTARGEFTLVLKSSLPSGREFDIVFGMREKSLPYG